MSKDLLLFLAVMPGEEIQAEVTAFKEYVRQQFGSGHALKSPPHITLFPPFRWTPSRLPDLKQTLRAFASKCHPFVLILHNFACFKPRVIFVDVAESSSLQQLQMALEQTLTAKLQLKSDRPQRFHPHMTVAFKDLRRSVFPHAWAYFSQQEYRRRFEVKAFYLLLHDGRHWQVESEFGFGIKEEG